MRARRHCAIANISPTRISVRPELRGLRIRGGGLATALLTGGNAHGPTCRVGANSIVNGPAASGNRGSKLRGALISLFLLIVSSCIALGASEAFLRLKNSSMRNYDIEMWRYARLLKHRSTRETTGVRTCA